MNTFYQDSTVSGANVAFTLRDNNSFLFYALSSASVYSNLLTISTNAFISRKNMIIDTTGITPLGSLSLGSPEYISDGTLVI